MQTTSIFRCGGLAEAAQLAPWCGAEKIFRNAAACRSASARHERNPTFIRKESDIHILHVRVFAVAAAASARHPYRMYGFTA